jgi:hypothetical protein
MRTAQQIWAALLYLLELHLAVSRGGIALPLQHNFSNSRAQITIVCVDFVGIGKHSRALPADPLCVQRFKGN